MVCTLSWDAPKFSELKNTPHTESHLKMFSLRLIEKIMLNSDKM